MNAPNGSDDRLDQKLSELLSDAVSDVEPGDALDSIQNRTKVTPMSARRPWLFAVGGAVVATAAVITAIAVTGGSLTGAEPEPGPANHTGQTDNGGKNDGTPTPTEPPSESSAPSGATVPVYFAGDTPQGPRLYREFQADAQGDPLVYSANASVTGSAEDPDYWTMWPDGTSVSEASYDGDVITVSVDGAPHDLPSGMTDDEAGLALQQVVYSVQAALGQGRVGVQFLLDGDRSDQVLGQPTSEPVTNAPVLDTLSLVSLTTPSEGDTVSNGTLEVSGVANSFEANVIIRVQRWEGTEIVAQEPITAEGWMDDKLFPFAGTIDLSGVPAGKYDVMAMTDDPSGGAEGNGAFTDTRVIIIE